MYDAKSEANEFIGDSREEAIANAVRFYGVEEAELVVSEPASGVIYGLGARKVVVAFPKSAPAPRRDSEGDSGGGRSERGDRGDRGDRGERGERGRPRRGERDRDRGSKRGERGERSDRGDRGREAPRESDLEAEPAQKPAAPKTESRGVAEGKLGEIGQFLLGVVERMGLGEFRVSESAEGDFVVYELRGEAAVALGSGDGRAVDALQILGNQAAMRLSEDAPRVVVDAEGDLERRSTFLERLAKRAAARAAETNRSVALDPMNARDRRVLHVSVKELEGVATMSVGTGRYRQVVVVPEGAPEYEEAVEASRSAEKND